MGIPETNICFSTLSPNKTISCIAEQRCCCYQDSYHAFPTCCSCTTYWWLWAFVAIFVLSTVASILAMYLRRRKRVHGSRSGSEILFGSKPDFNDKNPKLQEKDIKFDKPSKLPERPYANLSSQQKFPPSSGQEKRYLPPTDQKYMRPNDQKYVPPQDQKYLPPQDQKYVASVQNQKPLVAPPVSQQQMYMPPSQDYKYAPSTEQRYIPPQQYANGPSDQKYLPPANKYDNRDLGYRRVEQEYEKPYPKYEEREVERALGKESEEDLADYQKMDKREE